jgi:hypothetical protein
MLGGQEGTVYSFTNGARLDVLKFSFGHRVVDVWNERDEEIVCCDKVAANKHRLGKHTKRWESGLKMA